MTEAQLAKLIGYAVLAFSGLWIALKAAGPAWAYRKLVLEEAAALVLVFFFMEGITNAYFFGYVIVFNALGYPPVMVDHWSLVVATWSKAMMAVAIVWVMSRRA